MTSDMDTTDPAPDATKRLNPPQPKCERCGHVASFHRSGTDRCFVVGCDCPAWEGEAVKKG